MKNNNPIYDKDGKILDKYAEQAFSLFRSKDPARTSEDVAFAVGAQAARMGLDKVQLKKWLQTAYSAVWVKQSNLNPGLDLKDVSKALLKGFRRGYRTER